MPVQWVGRIETNKDGWVKYGAIHAYDRPGSTGEKTISLCGKLDITNRRDVEECGNATPQCKLCRKKML